MLLKARELFARLHHIVNRAWSQLDYLNHKGVSLIGLKRCQPQHPLTSRELIFSILSKSYLIWRRLQRTNEWYLTCAWSEISYPWAGGRWWWSSSPLRWWWESAGSAAARPTETRRSRGTPPSGRGMHSSHPRRKSPTREIKEEILGWHTITRAYKYTPEINMYCVTRHSVLTLALASRVASASAAMALCSWCGSFTSLMSTRSTLMPQLSVASSRLNCIRQKEEERTPVV